MSSRSTPTLLSLMHGIGLAMGVLLGQGTPDTLAFFENRIRPVLAEHCYPCHSSAAGKTKGGLRLDSGAALLQGGDSGPAIHPGDPERSLLILAIRQSESSLVMPPPKDGRLPLSEQSVRDLTAWVKLGAPFPGSETPLTTQNPQSHWSFQPIQIPPIPPVKATDWIQTSIDSFILRSLETQGLTPAPAADKRTWMRRVSFDLTGLPPKPEELDAFVEDMDPGSFARVVDRLLDSPHYGERWGRHWLDVVRYADTAGETADYPVPDAWRYRNYVVNSFNADKPYDEFLREQVAGDILARMGTKDRYAERMIATGFLAQSRRFGFDSENYHHLTLQDTIDTLGQTVLGLSLGCARCHNHKFDPIPSTDYYALYGIFESTRYAFPGSEQKTKRRALVPLVPPEEARTRWHDYELRVATLTDELKSLNQPIPSVVLRFLDDLDGDFEMQAPANGGSKGVLVPPWVYDGPISITTDAQSPFKHLHALGSVGAHIPAGTNTYFFGQAIPAGLGLGKDGPLYLNLEFQLETNSPDQTASHRFWLGAKEGAAVLEFFLGQDALMVKTGNRLLKLRSLTPNHWQALQIQLDPRTQTISGIAGSPGDEVPFRDIPFPPDWNGQVGFIGMDSHGKRSGSLPGLRVDNLGLQNVPLAAISTERPRIASEEKQPKADTLRDQLKQLVGMDGDFELQLTDTPPSLPWHPGPNSSVQISDRSQSPYHNHYPRGKLGIHLPKSSAYNGFGQTLPKVWRASNSAVVFVGFDFRCAEKESGPSGSWRYYIGHDAGPSPAVELYFNHEQFFRRSEDRRDPVAPLQSGKWYQVQLRLDLNSRHYTGSLSTLEQSIPFEGKFAPGWEGSLDYTFIDSYGHLPGVKPGLDVDQFILQNQPLAPLSAPETTEQPTTSDRATRRQKVQELQDQLKALTTTAEGSRRELEQLLAKGPFDMAYGVTEGTPRNSRLHMRGEPERLGEEIPRGFLKALGGGILPQETLGSGRWELAQWLTRTNHPLTARVMANRIWQYHFGTGLVKTPNDFGVRGQPPTHPELLDHLATRFIQSGWSVKAMHRLILLSATYRQSSPMELSMQANGVASKTSKTSTEVYSGIQRRRLSAEEIRDTILWVSGDLNTTPGQGHPFPTPIGWGYTQHGPFSAVYDHDQRSLYLMTQRLKRHPFLALFDGADPNASTPDRRTTTVPTQSLFFLNDRFVHEKALSLAARLQQNGPTLSQQIDRLYRLALGRHATDLEITDATKFLERYSNELSPKPHSSTVALSALIRVLWATNEFLHVD